MTDSASERRVARPGRWFPRWTKKTTDVESQRRSSLSSPSHGPVIVADDSQILQHQPQDKSFAGHEEAKGPKSKGPHINVSEDVSCDPNNPSGSSSHFQGHSSPTPPPVSLFLEAPRPALLPKNSSAYYQPLDIYRAAINTDKDAANYSHTNDSPSSSYDSLQTASSIASKGQPLARRSSTEWPTTPECKRSRMSNPWTLSKWCWEYFTSVFDPKCFWNMLDMREIFLPFTWKRYSVLTVIAGLIATLWVTNHYTHWIYKSMAITRSNMLPVLIIVLGLEPIMITIILIFAKIPDLDPEQMVAPPVETEKTVDIEAQAGELSHGASELTHNKHRTALVIPCHNSDQVAMLRVLKSAYPHFRPCDIFVVDNSRSMHPKDSVFRDFIREQSPEINYIWSPVGSKNYAQLVGAVAAEHHEFIMTMDDDVELPPSFRPPIHKINNTMKGVGFPLKATNAAGEVSFGMVAWQDCEYRMAGLTKLAEEEICGGAAFPHGAGWFCERETMIDLISNYHSLDFIAEDVNTGIALMRMKKLLGWDSSCVLETEVPTTVFGKGLNWYHQRVRSWEMGRHGRLLAFFDRLFFSWNGLTSPTAIIAQKFILIYSIACILVDWIRIPVFATMFLNGDFWRQAMLLSLVSILPILWFKYVSCRRRPDLQPTLHGALTIPLYKQMYYLVSVVGGIRALVYYIGAHKRPLTVKQMIAAGDERIVWLDPRWATNKAYLADEGEALRAKKAAENEAVRAPVEVNDFGTLEFEPMTAAKHDSVQSTTTVISESTVSSESKIKSTTKHDSLQPTVVSEKEISTSLPGSPVFVGPKTPVPNNALRSPRGRRNSLEILPAPPKAYTNPHDSGVSMSA